MKKKIAILIKKSCRLWDSGKSESINFKEVTNANKINYFKKINLNNKRVEESYRLRVWGNKVNKILYIPYNY